MHHRLTDKIHDQLTLESQLKEWRADSKKIVFTNGVFDILHAGHVSYLAEAAALGDILVLGLNNDASVRSLQKGEERPLNDEQSRAAVLAGLQSVDAVLIFSDSTPLELIKWIKPDVLIKGGDYDVEQMDGAQKDYIVGSKEVKESGGEVRVISFLDGYSTTSLVNKIKHGGKD
jgi:rfaE bifunctional protein nucleotidyltransferase chain/domain